MCSHDDNQHAVSLSFVDTVYLSSLQNLITYIHEYEVVMSPSRTERRQDAAKRQIMGVLHDSNKPIDRASASTLKPSKFVLDANLNGAKPEHIQLLVDDLKKEMLDRQKSFLTAEAQTGKQEQHHAYCTGMLKISKSLKKMTVRDFNKAHNCNLLELLTANVGKKRPLKATETPAPAMRGKAAATPTRTVARGEALL